MIVLVLCLLLLARKKDEHRMSWKKEREALNIKLNVTENANKEGRRLRPFKLPTIEYCHD